MKKVLLLVLALAMLLSVAACGKQAVQTHKENGVTVVTDAFPENTVVKVAEIKQEAPKYQTAKKALPAAIKMDAYEITAQSEGVSVQPDGTVEVTFPIPESYDSAKHDVEVYFVADDGSVEKITATATAQGVVAKLQHFSTYVVILVEKKAAASSQSSAAASSNGASSSPAASSTPASSTPASSVTATSSQAVSIPTLTKVQATDLVQNFLWASKFSYNKKSSPQTAFYNTDFKNLDALTVLSFLYRYCNEDLKKYQKKVEYDLVTTVPKSVMDSLAKKHLGYPYDFTKDYTEDDYFVIITYDENKKNVVFTEIAGGFGDPDGYQMQSYSQKGDTLTAELMYHSMTDQKPSGVEGKDWIDVSEEDYEAYYKLSHPTTLTMKYVDGVWRLMSMKAK
ncbi:MAG: hypothetical protein J6B12_02825 [Clostridia bacterium]|nr:hypothetical protein [Clostridia bacterium]